ncbi:hypothetical protein N8730_00255 [Flavobacteriaceae bacterium]|nr:hypothetical protein [Flavobacteriaceae bacterium]
MEEFKLYILKKIITIGGIVVLLFFFNYTTDFYGVLSVRKTFVDFTPNERSLKLDHIINSSSKSKLLFADSRGGIINNDNEFADWYNMSYSMGVPEEFFDDLVLILNKGRDIKEVVILLDEVSLFEFYKAHEKQVLRKVVNLNSLERFQYLFLLPNFEVLKELFRVLSKDLTIEKNIKYDIYDSGSLIESNFLYDFSEIKCVNRFPEKTNFTTGLTELFDKKLSVLEQIKDFCEKNSIKITFASQPFSSKYILDGFRVSSYFKFLDYAALKEFEIVKPAKCLIFEHNEGQWRDLHHYNSVIGGLVGKALLN